MGIKRFRNGAWEEIGTTNRIIKYSGSGFKNVMKQEKEEDTLDDYFKCTIDATRTVCILSFDMTLNSEYYDMHYSGAGRQVCAFYDFDLNHYQGDILNIASCSIHHKRMVVAEKYENLVMSLGYEDGRISIRNMNVKGGLLNLPVTIDLITIGSPGAFQILFKKVPEIYNEL